MKQKKIILVIFLSIIAVSVGLTQDLETKLLQLRERNKLHELRAKLELIKKKYPHHAVPYYIEAFIEKDGEQAIKLYKNFIKRFPQSHYTTNAKYKIAQFYFAKGLYHSAKRLLDDIITSHAGSAYADDAYYLMIRCFIALGLNNEAKTEIKNFIKNYPRSPYKKLANSDLTQLNKTSYKFSKDRSLKKIGSSLQNYTIQIGAYRDRNNAIKQMKTISNWEYPVEILTKVVNDKLFYLVWVGNFETEEQALNFGEVFKKKYDLPFYIVRKVDH